MKTYCNAFETYMFCDTKARIVINFFFFFRTDIRKKVVDIDFSPFVCAHISSWFKLSY